eukprot:CAMPEP_0197622898 /NCGR_PEP_ID=MMETSP1338-20131121/3010_1 /TAXON_ID=43686 ORGANISM="Pelagodinium beii, Strain RCC1491" /NCGR_SAMPLE_ID=MMETSP1338 /ASSEMBLY_ACC=CAM_ASM_000754 /LENGTH=59 /DNA_ID=CAMNT_0043192677 /DNA_START=26 /DNA_END=202 /DNA_ORIENTATION=-
MPGFSISATSQNGDLAPDVRKFILQAQTKTKLKGKARSDKLQQPIERKPYTPFSIHRSD